MNLQLKLSKQAQNDLDFHKKSGNKAIQKKLISLLKEVSNSPFEGTGKPELLKYDLSGLCHVELIMHIDWFMKFMKVVF